MKYISKAHLIVLMVLVIIVGGLLLAGERFTTSTEESKKILTPTQMITDEEKPIYKTDQSQLQISKPATFVIRPGQSKLTYTEAVELYKDDILQFNQDCQLATASRSFHLNNEIMIDNRSSKANTFVVGNTLIAIGPYDFAFMILKEKGDSIPVSCGDRKNIATLVIQ